MKETRALECALTNEEFIAHALAMAEAETKVDKLETEAKDVAKRWRERIGGERTRSRRHRRCVATRVERRDVPCTWYADYIGRQMQLRRDDTQEIVTVRTMTPEELQLHFPITGEDRRLPPKRDDHDDDGEILDG